MAEIPTQPPVNLPASFGHYRLTRLLGQGGMGTVYLAHDTQLDRQVALKIPQLGSGAQVLARFYAEARAAAALHHPNICPIHDVGEHDGLPYLTMAYIEGKPLDELVRARPLQPRQSVVLVRKLALALAEAHKHNVIHRDLKPGNIMLDRRGEPVIMDFGLARRLQSGDPRMTQDGMALGTPAYMPPEQVRGKMDAIGPASDIYSLGVVLYELLAGRLPFTGDVMAVVSQVVLAEAPPPSHFRPDLDSELEAICLKAMAKQIETRYASMSQFAGALAGYLRNQASTADLSLPVSSAPPAPRPARPAASKTPGPGIHASQLGGLRSMANVCADLPSRRGAEGPFGESHATSPVAGPKRRKRKPVRGFSGTLRWLLVPAGVGVLALAVALALFGLRGNRSSPASSTARLVSRESESTHRVRPVPNTGAATTPVVPREATPSPPEPDQEKKPPKESGPGDEFPAQPTPGPNTENVTRGEVRRFVGAKGWVYRILVSRDGKRVMSSGDAIHVWDLDSGVQIRVFGAGQAGWGLALSPDGRLVISGSGRDHWARVWDLDSGREVRRLVGHTNEVWGAAFAPDGRHAATGAFDGTVRIWDLQTARELKRFGIRGEQVRCLAYSPDGRYVAAGHFQLNDGRSGTIRLWDVATGLLVHAFTGHGSWITCVTFSPDGRELLSSSFDRTVRLWDVTTGSERKRFQGHPGGVDNVAFLPDGKRFVSIAMAGDAPVWLWDIASAKVIHRFSGHDGSTICVAVAPDGRQAVTGGKDSTLRLWQLPR
jgi:serine/threonine protein kinase